MGAERYGFRKNPRITVLHIISFTVMKNIQKAFRTLFKKGRRNGVKILSLSMGLSMGLILIGKVLFEQTFDSFYPDIDRVYRIEEKYDDGSAKMEHGGVSGAVAQGMKAEIAEIEAATCVDAMGNVIFFDEDKNRYTGFFIMADEFYFDVLPRPVILGDEKEILRTPLAVMVSESTARKMKTDISQVIGESLRMDHLPGRTFTIRGVFKDVPDNTNLKYDAIVSLVSFPELYGWNPLEWWLGGDRFLTYIKLYPGINPHNLSTPIRQMQERHQLEQLRQAEVDLEYMVKPLRTYHSDIPENRRMIVLLGILAFALIFTAVMNYILIVISTMVVRTKEVAVQKCYGAAPKDIISGLMAETFVHLLLSLILAFIIVLSFRGMAQEILKVSLWSLFTVKTSVILLIVCFLIFLFAGLVPASLLTRIPIAAAFRSYKESKQKWKLGLLSVQFVAAAFLLTLLVVIGKQYQLMMNTHHGYVYENLLYTKLSGVSATERQRAIDHLKQLPFVTDVTSSDVLLMEGCSGNNILLPGDDRDLFNINDMEDIQENFFPLMQVPVIAGRNFEKGKDASNSLMVSRSFVDKMAEVAGWTDGVLEKTVRVSGYDESGYQIVGVFEDIIFGDLSSPRNQKPAIAFYSENPRVYVTIKVNSMAEGIMDQVDESLKQILPEKDITVNHYGTGIADLYRDSMLFRNAVLIGGLATLLISLIGLIGYTTDEVNRRSAEVAIRKINGATILDVEGLFVRNIVGIAIPAILLGGSIAWMVSGKWLENFAMKTDLSFIIFLGSGLVVLTFILAVVVLNCYDAATDNPVNSLKNE